jgi:hypothetical protein
LRAGEDNILRREGEVQQLPVGESIFAESTELKAATGLLADFVDIGGDCEGAKSFLVRAKRLAYHAFSSPTRKRTSHLSASTLTGEGIPMELALSLSPMGLRGYGCNFDPATATTSFASKIVIVDEIAKVFLSEFEAHCSFPGTNPTKLHARLMDLLFPASVVRDDRNKFAIWLGLLKAARGPDTLKLFYNIRPKGRHGDSTLKAAMRLVHPTMDSSTLETVNRTLPAQADPVCLALEKTVAGRSRAKVYYRCMGPILWSQLLTRVEKLGFEQLAMALGSTLTIITPGQAGGTERSVLIYTAFLDDGSLVGMSVYLVLGSFVPTDAAACPLISKVGDRLEIDTTLYHKLLQRLNSGYLSRDRLSHHTVLGFGYDSHALRMNVYLKPSWGTLSAVKSGET